MYLEKFNCRCNITFFKDMGGVRFERNNDENAKCKVCKKTATKRCSRCKAIYYCSRECQIKDWITHRFICQKLLHSSCYWNPWTL